MDFIPEQNALVQSIALWADVFAGDSPTLPAGELAVVNDATEALRFVTGYDLVNGLDRLILDGPLIPG